MNRVLVILIILVSCSDKELAYSWFENDWTSDAPASIAINPEYSALAENDLQTITEMYGKIRWSIRGDTMTFYDERYEPEINFESTFEIRPVSATHFEMVTEAQTNTVWKTESGFCTVPEPSYITKFDGSRSELTIECFRLSGT